MKWDNESEFPEKVVSQKRVPDPFLGMDSGFQMMMILLHHNNLSFVAKGNEFNVIPDSG